MLSKKASNMGELEENDLRLMAFFLDILREKFSPYFQNKLVVKFSHKVSFSPNVVEEVMAIVEIVPNRNFGKPPCHFEEPVIMISPEMRDGFFVLMFTRAIYKNDDAMHLLKEVKRGFEVENNFHFTSTMFSPVSQ